MNNTTFTLVLLNTPIDNNTSFDLLNNTNSNQSSHLLTNRIIFAILTGVILTTIIILTIIGNILVIAAVLLERNLRTPANYLVLSLAVADFLVACLVMPLGAVYEITQQWTMGRLLCEIWTSADVLCCTARYLFHQQKNYQKNYQKYCQTSKRN